MVKLPYDDGGSWIGDGSDDKNKSSRIVMGWNGLMMVGAGLMRWGWIDDGGGWIDVGGWMDYGGGWMDVVDDGGGWIVGGGKVGLSFSVISFSCLSTTPCTSMAFRIAYALYVS